jgi:dihydrofolate reductase
MTLPLIIVVAVAENGVIGRDNRLLWHLRTDLRRFKELTWGKPLIMGRKTYESIGKPLPGRETVVLTRDPAFAAEGVRRAASWEEALAIADDLGTRMEADAIAAVGGAEIYALALPQAEFIHLTQVHAAPEGDAFFPDYDRAAFRETHRKDYPQGANDEHPFTTVDLQRRTRSRR